MGVIIPQVITSDRATGAQVIDGSLKFDDDNKQFLKKTFSSGNSRTWTWSAWIKRDNFGSDHRLFTSDADGNNQGGFKFTGDQIQFFSRKSGTFNINLYTAAVLRDTGWYHLMVAVDTTISSPSTDRVKLYVNGALQTIDSSYNTYPSQNYETRINTNIEHLIGRFTTNDSQYMNGAMSQIYLIDGAALGPENFGFTDPLTNTWKPKKYNHRKDLYGVTWSSALVGDASGFQSTALAADGFNGEVGTSNNQYAQNNTGSNPSTITFTPVGGIKFNSSIQVYLINAANTVNVNGEGAQTIAANEWVTVKSGSGTLSTLVFSRPTTGGASFAGIRVDGHILIDSRNDNSFYLPLDGNSPIGQDQSGQGNNWTPVNFGGSVALDNPQVSGARPILNTTQGGTQAGVGVFGSKENVGYAVTYYDDGGGNKYYIDGVKQATLTGLIRGATYTFDTVALGSTHPFRFSDSDGGSEYTNGVAAITGTATTITIPYDAPETLYYYCTAHSGMGSSITGITTNEKLADQYASHCTLALPLVGANSDVSASIACTMTNKAVTSDGNVAASSVLSNFYSGSFYFEGTDNILTIPDNSDFSFGSGDYTIEMWVYPTRISGTQENLITRGTSGFSGFIMSVTNFLDSTSGSAWDANITYDNPLVANKWQHIAVCRYGDTWTVYINGVANGSDTASGSVSASGTLTIGGRTGQTDFQGYMNDVRLYKGVAKYTSDFVVPSTSPDILPDTPSGVSGSSKLTKITDGAVHFDGSGYLFAGSSSDYTFGTGDFTIEGYFYFDNSTTTPNDGLWQISGTSGGLQAANSTLSCNYETSGGRTRQLYFGSAGGWRQNGSDNEFSPFMWNHVAEVRSGGVISVYINGKLSQSWSDTTDYTFTDCVVGAYYSTSYRWNGYVSNFRVIKGTALYTANFTPPTRELTNVTNTKLLCCQSNTLAGSADVSPSISGINDGIVWSEEATITPPSSGFNSGGGISQAFDGSTTTLASGAGSRDEFFVIDFSRDITVSTSLEVWMNSGASQFKVNDGSFSSSLNNGAWRSLSFTGTLSKLTVKGDSPQTFGNFAPRLSAIRIDGSVILTDPVTRNGDAAATNFNPFNTDINTVRGQETGYCTLNPLFRTGTYSDGNLVQTTTAGNGHYRANIGITTSSGKFYFEYQPTGSNVPGMVGFAEENHAQGSNLNGTTAYSYYGTTGNKQGSPSNVDTSYGATFTFGDVIGVAFDSDNGGSLEYFKNGESQGIAFSNEFPNFPYFPAFSAGSSSNTTTYNVNFGQKPFKFPPPDGFQPLNTANIRPETVIARPDQFVGITTWRGNDTQRDIRTLNIKPDLVWIKQRTGSANHSLMDTVRGATKNIVPNDTQSEGTETGYLNAFIDNGFSLGTSSIVNDASNDYVAWAWKAGGSKNTFNVDDVGYASASAAGLTGGDITPTGASVGTKQGFSIIKFTGSGSGTPSIPHGLSEAPKIIIQKDTGASTSWRAFAYDGSTWKIGNLNNTDAFVSATETAPTSSLFYANGNGNAANTQIAYLWHDVPGLQKFGQFAGNNSADGVFVELGFKPAILLIKNDNSTGDWIIWDNERNPHNPVNRQIWPYTTSGTYGAYDQVASNYPLDFLSNGFKMRTTDADMNGSSRTYIYAAWAEAPTVNLYGGGANAR